MTGPSPQLHEPRQGPQFARWRQKQATRETILEAARKVFAERGYERASVREIAATAGVSTGAIFSNWSGIVALFTEAAGRPPITDSVAAQMLLALQRIAEPMDCGCKPCTGACRTREALIGEVDEMKDIAYQAIASLKVPAS